MGLGGLKGKGEEEGNGKALAHSGAWGTNVPGSKPESNLFHDLSFKMIESNHHGDATETMPPPYNMPTTCPQKPPLESENPQI